MAERFRQAREVIWHSRDFHLRAGHIEISRHQKESFAPRRQNLVSDCRPGQAVLRKD